MSIHLIAPDNIAGINLKQSISGVEEMCHLHSTANEFYKKTGLYSYIENCTNHSEKTKQENKKKICLIYPIVVEGKDGLELTKELGYANKNVFTIVYIENPDHDIYKTLLAHYGANIIIDGSELQLKDIKEIIKIYYNAFSAN